MPASVESADHVERTVSVPRRSGPDVSSAVSRLVKGLWRGTLSSLQRVRPRLSASGVRHWWNGTFAYWPELETALGNQRRHLADDGRRLKEDLGLAHSHQIAAADLFVERAHIHLTIRGRIYAVAGTLLAILCFVLLAYIVAYIIDFDIAALVGNVGGLTWPVVVLTGLRGAALAGFAGAAVYFTASLSRAFFHESTALFHRRHALRFGRMYVYLKYGETNAERRLVTKLIRDYSKPAATYVNGEADRANGSARMDSGLVAHLIDRDVRADDLERAFGLNLQVQTAFRDIKPDTMSANVYSRTLEELTKVVEGLARKRNADDPA
jgi:hypothetical protein